MADHKKQNERQASGAEKQQSEPARQFAENVRAPARQVQRLSQLAGNQAVTRLIQGSAEASPAESATTGMVTSPLMRAYLSGDARRAADIVRAGRGHGAPLPEQLTQGPAVDGQDTSGVRIHTDEFADRSSHDIGAKAYTLGQHIFFQRQQYRPETVAGRHLLLHELAHIHQQSSVANPAIQRQPVAGTETSTRAEREAEEAARIAGTPTLRTEETRIVRNLSYAFFYTGGGYGNSAREFVRTFYPEHIRVTARSFEAMFDRLYADMQRFAGRDEVVHIDEIVIVTHANSAGGLQIPLAGDDVRPDVRRARTFTPWDLAALQEEFQDSSHRLFRRRQRFRERRRAVVANAIDDRTQIVIRGCEFGQSDDGLTALRSLFGGNVYVWAPKGFQGYEVAPVGSSHIRSAEEAFDFLQEHELVPVDLDLTADEKATYIAREFGIRGSIPTQFFVMSQEEHDKLKGMSKNQQLSEGSESLKAREGVDIPSMGEFWGLSSPTHDVDPLLDGLPLAEIERQARLLKQNYRPEFAPMLLRLRNAWERHPDQMQRLQTASSGDPLGGFPPIELFGDSYTLGMDASRYEDPLQGDSFEEELLPFAPPVEGTEAANEFVEGIGIGEEPDRVRDTSTTRPTGSGSVSPPSGSRTLGRRGTGERRAASPAQLRAARDFSKLPRQEPEPEEEQQPVDPLLSLAADHDELLRQILELLPEEGWSLGDSLTVAELTVSILTAPPTVGLYPAILEGTALLFAWEAAALIAPIISIAAVMVAISDAAEAQEQGSQALGVKLGIENLSRHLDAAAESGSISVAELEEGLLQNYEVISQIAYSYPIGAKGTMKNIRIGLRSVATSANRTMRHVEETLREGFVDGGLSPEDVEKAYNAIIVKFRRDALLALIRAGFELVRQRREALDARQD